MASVRPIDRRFISKRRSNQWPPTCLEGWQVPFERVNNVSMHPDAALFLGNADWVADPHWLQQAGIDIIWCAVDPESRYYDQLSERRELLKQRFGDALYMWNFSPHYSAQEGVGEEWNFANVVGEHLYRGHRVVVHCAQAEYRGPAAAAWFCMVHEFPRSRGNCVAAPCSAPGRIQPNGLVAANGGQAQSAPGVSLGGHGAERAAWSCPSGQRTSAAWSC
jgi:hypothetical protein